MSSIDKLLIRGIRSFDPDQAAVIEFYSPVTLIVGHNGAGKTTVIECLKYATCGDLPPNSKGGAFVHDPKLAGESEVKGQVKLKFKSVRGQSMVVTRSLQSTLKRGGKIEQKTLEGLLVTTDPVTGEQVSISSRCAELDAEIPVQLGVSRAVLESVIFCHQEDSQWPLSEPSLLKKRFDDLFAATRYTKALEALRASRKELMTDLKLEQQKLDYLKSDKEKALKLQSVLVVTKQQVTECDDKIDVTNGEIEVVNREIQKLVDELSALSSTQAELERLQHEHLLCSNNMKELNIEELPESDSELSGQLEQHSRLLKDHQGEVQAVEQRKQEIVHSAATKQQFVNSLLSEKGTILALTEEYNRKSAFVTSLFQAIASLPYTPGNVQTLKGNMDALAKELQILRERYSLEVAKAADQKSLHQVKKSGADEAKRLRKRAADEQRQKLISLIQLLDELDSSQSLDSMNDRVSEEEQSASRSSEILSAGNYPDRLSEYEERIKESEQETKKVNEMIANMSVQAESRAKYDLKVAEKQRKNDLCLRLLTELKQEFPELREVDLEKEFDRLCKAKERSAKTLQERVEQALNSLSMITSKHDHYTALKATTEKDLKQKQALITDDFTFNLETAEEEYKRILELSSSAAVYASMAQRLQLSHACPVCDRGFADRVQEECTLARLSKNITSSDLLEAEQRLTMLRMLNPTADDVVRLSLELPELSKQLAMLSEEKEKIQLDVEELRSDQSRAVLEDKKLLSAKRKVEEYLRTSRECDVLGHDLEYLSSELSTVTTASSLKELKTKLHTLEEQQRTYQAEYIQLSREFKMRQQDAQSRSDRVRDLREEMMKSQLRQSEKCNLEKQQQDLEGNISGLEMDIQRMDVEIQKMHEGYQLLCDTLDQSLQQSRSTLDMKEKEYEEKRIKYAQFSNSLNELQGITDPADRLQTVDMQLEQAQFQLQSIQGDLDSIDVNLSAIRQGALARQTRERLIKDTLRLRELRKKLSHLEENMKQLTKKLDGFDRNVTTLSLQRHQLRLSDLMGQRSGIAGEKRQLEEQLSRISKELSSDYPKIDFKHREQQIRVEANILAADDLEKYSKALDTAIMRYHAVKMDEVNRQLRDLWAAVYTGTDIDAVEIRADAEGVGQRTYNYRVIMIKGTVELDMRGRSSAGQKVLTSLLIRLALADTFATHCGILALDEPTTNLDRDNISALAEALADLIRARRQQANFQLLIITHDEDFVEALARHECAEHYWRVGKDSRQHSIIERQSLSSY